MHSTTLLQPPIRLAAMDLGSNSFHLVVAEYTHGELRLLTKHRQRTVMASGLNEQQLLDEAAIERGLNSISDFSALLKEEKPTLLRALGTNTLRVASNSQHFTDQAEARLGHPVETICGIEEARLIYLGACHAMSSPDERHLVIDIGGGSTELIIGENGTPLLLNSLPLGCVVYRHRYFADGLITNEQMATAYTAALAELLPFKHSYLQQGWSSAVATSGTAQTATSVLNAMGFCPENLITKQGLLDVQAHLLNIGTLSAVELPGLEAERASILPAGVAILLALFDAFGIEEMRYVEGALREGMLYDLLQRGTADDARHRTVTQLHEQYRLDGEHSERVAHTAEKLFAQVAEAWQLTQEERLFLIWAATLHELGRTVGHHKHAQHGAYLLENSDLSGFSLQEQRLLAFLVRAQEGTPHYATLPLSAQQPFLKLALLLRIAIAMHTPRQPLPQEPVATINQHGIALQLPESEHKVLWRFLLTKEAAVFSPLGIALC